MYKAIKGYEGIYEVNELGQVRSIDRMVEHKNRKIINYKGKELKPDINKGGYANVRLSKNGIIKNMKVHRLVAETFLSNPNNLPEVHHKNHDRRDNRVENLQWVTRTEQRDNHWKMAKLKAQAIRLRVIGHGIDKIYNSAREVERELGVSNTYVLNTAKGKFKQAKGYRIYFAD